MALSEGEYDYISDEPETANVRAEHLAVAMVMQSPDKDYVRHMQAVRKDIRTAGKQGSAVSYLQDIAKKTDEEIAQEKYYKTHNSPLMRDVRTLLCVMRTAMTKQSLGKMDKLMFVACIDELLGPVQIAYMKAP
jgi:hypothetical protein